MPKTWLITGRAAGLASRSQKAAMRAGDWICFEYLQAKSPHQFLLRQRVEHAKGDVARNGNAGS